MIELAIGTVFADRYVIVERLGGGGMGVVYRARDRQLGRDVAVKVLRGKADEDREGCDRLLREARAATRAASSSVVKVYDAGVTERGEAYLVLELVAGTTLRELVSRGRLDREEVVRIVKQVAAALGAVHRAHLVHRDVKPDNVMLRADGSIVLLDFGIVKGIAREGTAVTALTALTGECSILGTPAYLAPEQAMGDEVSAASDQFALGVMTYELLTARLPWKHTAIVQMLAEVIGDVPPPASTWRPDLEHEVDAVIARAIEKQPERRFACVESFAAALAAALCPDQRIVPDDAPAPLPLPPPSRPARRGKTKVAAVFASCALGLGALAFGPLHERTEARPVAQAQAPTETLLCCPMLEARGVDAPSGWLGAAAADLACRRAAWLTGGSAERTRTPPELLALPRQPIESFPSDPYGADDARARSVAQASPSGCTSWIDGSVERGASGFDVEIVMRGGDGSAPRGIGRAESLHRAVAIALDEAFRRTRQAALDPNVRRWLFVPDVEAGLALDDLETGYYTADADTRDACASLGARRAELGPLVAMIAERCAPLAREPSLEPLRLDRSSPGALALTATAAASSSERAGVLAELSRLRDAERSPLGRSQLAKATTAVALAASDGDRAQLAVLEALKEAPRDLALWDQADRAGLLMGNAAAFPAWAPGIAESWLTYATRSSTDAARWIGFERAYALGGRDAARGLPFGEFLVRKDQRERVRQMADRYLAAGGDTLPTGQYLMALIDIREARFEHARERLRAATEVVQPFSERAWDAFSIASASMSLGFWMDRAPEAGDAWAKRFVLASPPKIVLPIAPPYVQAQVMSMCMMASPDVARACFDVLDGWVAAGSFPSTDDAAAFLAGAKAYARGDMKGARDAWRRVIRSPLRDYLRPDAFDRAGDEASARTLDSANAETFAGINAAEPREARRALAKGDDKRAKEIAARVVDACEHADVEIPIVREMKRILGRR